VPHTQIKYLDTSQFSPNTNDDEEDTNDNKILFFSKGYSRALKQVLHNNLCNIKWVSHTEYYSTIDKLHL